MNLGFKDVLLGPIPSINTWKVFFARGGGVILKLERRRAGNQDSGRVEGGPPFAFFLPSPSLYCVYCTYVPCFFIVPIYKATT